MNHQDRDLTTILHNGGYRITPQRQAVLEAFRETSGHVSADDIVSIVQNSLPAINRATVYRTLRFFCQMNLINATMSAAGRLEYEIAGSVTHNHIICRSCGTDLEIMGEDFECLRKLLLERYGFKVDSTHITLRGYCINCQANR